MTETFTTEVEPQAPASEQLSEDDRIVVSTTAGSVVVHDGVGIEMMRIDPPDGSVFRQPTWLDASTVVFSEASETGDHSLTAADASTGTIMWRAAMDSPPFYFSPAPQGALYATTSLRNNPLGPGLIVELIDHSGVVTLLSNESPFYTGWASDGGRLAIHIPGLRLDIFNGSGSETIAAPAGTFQAPVWVERGLVTLRTVGGTQRLSVWSDDSFRDIASIEGPAGFVASGDRVAIQAADLQDSDGVQASISAQQLEAIPGGRLMVVDLGSGEMQTVSTTQVVLFQWDRAGESLLYATLDDATASFAWHVWADGESTDVDMFVVQPGWVGNLVRFFDQYAQSVQLWSPSGQRVGFPAIVDGVPVVVVQPLDGSDPLFIPDSTWAAWAPAR